MEHVVTGLFEQSKKAGNAVVELKEAGFTNDISIVAKDPDSETARALQVKEDISDGTAVGAITGGVLGGLFGLIATVGGLVLPGFGTVLVAGPLAAFFGLTGVGAGALSGGFIGALIDAGIPEERARMYENAIKRGQILIAVTSNHENEQKIRNILDKHNVSESGALHAAV
jgi:uncharacterized membrane protein